MSIRNLGLDRPAEVGIEYKYKSEVRDLLDTGQIVYVNTSGVEEAWYCKRASIQSFLDKRNDAFRNVGKNPTGTGTMYRAIEEWSIDHLVESIDEIESWYYRDGIEFGLIPTNVPNFLYLPDRRVWLLEDQ